MAASALFENACALTASAFEIVPLPRIFTLSFDEMKPAAMSVSTVTSVSDFLAASSSSVERLMALNSNSFQIRETELGEATLKRHLATLEAELARVTRTRLCTLVSTGSRAAVARTCTAADPFIVMR